MSKTRAGALATGVIKMTLTPDELAWVDGLRGQVSRAEWARHRMMAPAVVPVEQDDGPELGNLLPLGRFYMRKGAELLKRDPVTLADAREVFTGPTGGAIVALLAMLGLLREPVGQDPGPDETYRPDR